MKSNNLIYRIWITLTVLLLSFESSGEDELILTLNKTHARPTELIEGSLSIGPIKNNFLKGGMNGLVSTTKTDNAISNIYNKSVNIKNRKIYFQHFFSFTIDQEGNHDIGPFELPINGTILKSNIATITIKNETLNNGEVSINILQKKPKYGELLDIDIRFVPFIDPKNVPKFGEGKENLKLSKKALKRVKNSTSTFSIKKTDKGTEELYTLKFKIKCNKNTIVINRNWLEELNPNVKFVPVVINCTK